METSALGIRPGSVIQDTYRVTKMIGEGGMGATFAGENLATGHAVAIKVITPQFARNSRAADLFRREANLLRTVQSDAVVRYETTMLDKDGQLYLVMEYIAGRTLGHYLDRGARLGSRDVLKLARRLYAGLDAIHRLGIVHRDISPDNILIPDDDILGAKFIDFGVASDTVGTEHSIIGDTFAGKISYAAPEQLGIGSETVGAAADHYSLALVLAKVAGLKVPGAGGSLAAAIDARQSDLRLPRETVSDALADLLEAMLKADPRARAHDPLDRIETALDRHDPARSPAPDTHPAGPEGAPEPFADDPPDPDGDSDTSPRRSPRNAIIACVAIGILLAGALMVYLQQDAAPPGGTAMDQAELAEQAIAAADPIAAVGTLIENGGAVELNAAYGALVALTNDDDAAGDIRAEAAMMAARMWDPATHDAATSPHPEANARAAARFYANARDHGADGAAAALERLDSGS